MRLNPMTAFLALKKLEILYPIPENYIHLYPIYANLVLNYK